MIGWRFIFGVSQKTERLVAPVPVVIFDPGGNGESCFCRALTYGSEQHGGHAHPLGRPV